MRKYLMLSALLSTSAISLPAQEPAVAISAENSTQLTFTLDQCLQYAFGNSFERQSLLLSEKSAAENTKQAKNNRRPNLNLSAGESASHVGSSSDINFSGNVGLNSGITIYQGGSISKNITHSEQMEEEAKLRTAKYDNSISIEILNAYLAILKNEETVKYKASLVSTSKEQAEQAKKKYEAGNMLESDYLVLEAQYASNQTDTLDANISRANNLLVLKRLMSMDPMANLSVVGPDTSSIEALALLPSQDDCVAKALETMPELKLTQSAIEIAETQTQITKAGRRPTIGASASVGTSHHDFDDFGQQLGDNFSQTVGVSFSMPLYDKGQTKSKLAQNKYTRLQAELDHSQTELQIKQTVVQQYQNVKLAYERYKMTKQRCDAYREVLRVYNVKFNLGSVVITDLLQQQDKYISAINEYVQAKYSFILNRKILDVYTGEGVNMQ